MVSRRGIVSVSKFPPLEIFLQKLPHNKMQFTLFKPVIALSLDCLQQYTLASSQVLDKLRN